MFKVEETLVLLSVLFLLASLEAQTPPGENKKKTYDMITLVSINRHIFYKENGCFRG